MDDPCFTSVPTPASWEGGREAQLHCAVADTSKHLHFDFLTEKEQHTRSGSLSPLDCQERLLGPGHTT